MNSINNFHLKFLKAMIIQRNEYQMKLNRTHFKF